MPSALMLLISANSSSTRSGERPSDGSSRMSSLRLRHQAAADRQHLLLAAGQRAGALALPLGEPREDRRTPGRGWARGARGRADRRRDRDSRAPSCSERCGGLPARGSGRARRSPSGRSRSIGTPSKRMRALREARMTPEMVRLSVDLPAPFEPSTATISPAPTARSTPRRISVAP